MLLLLVHAVRISSRVTVVPSPVCPGSWAVRTTCPPRPALRASSGTTTTTSRQQLLLLLAAAAMRRSKTMLAPVSRLRWAVVLCCCCCCRHPLPFDRHDWIVERKGGQEVGRRAGTGTAGPVREGRGADDDEVLLLSCVVLPPSVRCGT